MLIIFVLSILAAIISFLGKYLSKPVLVKLSILVSWIGAVSSLSLLRYINLSDLCTTYTFVDVFNFASIYGQVIRFGFRTDTLSALWTCITAILCAFTNLYSVGYMQSYAKFITYNNLFSASMLLFVSANNFLQSYVGWELITLFSYLLINYYHYLKEENGDIAFRVFILHKFGDIFFLISILLMVVYLGSFELKHFNSFHVYGINIHDIIFMLLLIPISIKSAQFGFMHWLKNAMIAPTPASAFLHAATIVSAGIYLFIRTALIFDLSNTIKMYAASYFIFTSIIGAIFAFKEYDLKKVLAYSTCSKIGLILATCCIGNYITAILFFAIHAFSKCALFFCVGNISHALSNERDMRKMGGLSEDLPKTYSVTILSTLLFLGIIPNVIDTSMHNSNLCFSIAIYIAEILAIFYMLRVVYFVFHGESHLDEKSRGYLNEKSSLLIVSTILLILANFIVRILIFMQPNNIVTKESVIQYIFSVVLFICCVFIYKSLKIDIAKYVHLSVHLPQIEFSSLTKKLISFQQFIENDVYSKVYVKIVQIGRKLVGQSDSEFLCLLVGGLLVLLTVINLAYGGL